MSPARARGALLVVALFALVLAACGDPAVEVTASPVPRTSEDVVASPTPEPSASPASPAPAEPSPTPAATFPLTGMATDHPGLDRPVFAVKVDNSPRAFPQAGLDRADIVYEEVVEGGVTRFLALFHSDLPETIGPVRSARLADAELLPPYRPILAYSGARPEVSAALRDTDAIALVVDPGGRPFRRDGDRQAPHNLFVDSAEAFERGVAKDEQAPASSGLTFGGLPTGGEVGTEVDIDMTTWQRTSWEFDATEQVYRRFSRGEPFRVTGPGRVGAANVIVILTDITAGGCCDSAGQRYQVTRLTGSGDAALLREGRRFDVGWVKDGPDDHLRLVFADGTDVPLAPGPSWIHLAPTDALD